MGLYNGKQLVAFGNFMLSKNSVEVTHADVMAFQDVNHPNFVAAFQPGEEVMVSFCVEMKHWAARVSKVHVFINSHSYDLDVTLPSGEVVRFHNVDTSFVYKKGSQYVNTPIGS